MYLPPNMKNYDPVKRKAEWEQRLKAAMDKTVNDILQSTEQKDSTLLLLENLEYKLQEARKEIDANRSIHRDQNFVRFSATVTDLLIELDKIDTTYASKFHKDKRTDIMEQIRSAEAAINSKVKCSGENCIHCQSKSIKVMGY